jgi:hypothetical protein
MNRSRTIAKLPASLTSRRLMRILGAPVLLSLAAATVAVGIGPATPVWADPFLFSTGNPDRLLGALSQPAASSLLETETADDFILTRTTSITSATLFGLIPHGTPLANISNVEVEVYHVFSKDSDESRTSGAPTFSTFQVPTRVNSPADQEIDAATRDGSAGTLTFSASVPEPGFTVLNTVVNGINPLPDNETHGEGSASGDMVLITITFTPPILLPADHYFFRPEVLVTGGEFLYLSAPRPIVDPGTPFAGDLQSWIRNSRLSPDWLRIGRDIIGGSPAPAFNQAFSLTGETVPEAGAPGHANCHGKSISASARQFGGLDAAASALGFSDVEALQDAFRVFCESEI